MKKKTEIIPLIAILTADWHFTHNMWRHRPEICDDAAVSLEQVQEHVYNLKIPIIAAGDLFDNARPSSRVVSELDCVLDNPFYDLTHLYISGNHDRVQPPWIDVLYGKSTDNEGVTHWHNLAACPYKFGFIQEVTSDALTKMQGVQELDAWTKPTNQWRAYGIDYVETADKLQEKLDELAQSCDPNTKNLLVLHQGVAGLIPKMTAELTDGMIPDGFDMVLCGHCHVRAVTTILTKGRKSIPLISPGSLHMCSIDEDPRKKVYLLAADGSVWSVPLITRRVISVKFSGVSESEVRETAVKVAASLNKEDVPEIATWRERIKTPILRVVYDTWETPKVKTIFETALREAGAAAHIFYTSKTEKVSNSLDTVIDDGMDAAFVNSGFDYAKAAFQTLEKDKKVRQIVETMLESTPSQESYTALKEEFIHAQNRKRNPK